MYINQRDKLVLLHYQVFVKKINLYQPTLEYLSKRSIIALANLVRLIRYIFQKEHLVILPIMNASLGIFIKEKFSFLTN